MPIEEQFLGDLLVNSGKGAVLNAPYTNADDVLDTAMFIMAATMSHVVKTSVSRPWYGIKGVLKDEDYEAIEASSFNPEEQGQFYWADNPKEALAFFRAALEDPVIRTILDGVMKAYRDAHILKSREQEVEE